MTCQSLPITKMIPMMQTAMPMTMTRFGRRP
jgi:hypothetical protein